LSVRQKEALAAGFTRLPNLSFVKALISLTNL
jgi:hypothetical protein